MFLWLFLLCLVNFYFYFPFIKNVDYCINVCRDTDAYRIYYLFIFFVLQQYYVGVHIRKKVYDIRKSDRGKWVRHLPTPFQICAIPLYFYIILVEPWLSFWCYDILTCSKWRIKSIKRNLNQSKGRNSLTRVLNFSREEKRDSFKALWLQWCPSIFAQFTQLYLGKFIFTLYLVQCTTSVKRVYNVSTLLPLIPLMCWCYFN